MILKLFAYEFYNIFYIWRWPISREALYVMVQILLLSGCTSTLLNQIAQKRKRFRTCNMGETNQQHIIHAGEPSSTKHFQPTRK